MKKAQPSGTQNRKKREPEKKQCLDKRGIKYMNKNM